MAELTCPHCGVLVQPEHVFCPNCTRSLRLAAPEAPYAPGRSTAGRSVALIVGFGLVGLCFLAVVPILAIPAAGTKLFRDTPKGSPSVKAACLTNIKQLSTAAMIYMADYDDRMFPTTAYMPALMPYTTKTTIFYCPQTSQPYSVNKLLLKVEASKIKDPAKTILFYEGSGQILAFPHGGTGNVSYADTSAKARAQSYVPVWKP